MGFFSDKQTGDLMSRVINDTETFELLYAHIIPEMITNFVTVVGVMAILLTINVKLALLTCIPIPQYFKTLSFLMVLSLKISAMPILQPVKMRLLKHQKLQESMITLWKCQCGIILELEREECSFLEDKSKRSLLPGLF